MPARLKVPTLPASVVASVSLDTIVANLRDNRAAASADAISDGRRWYPYIGSMIADIARESFYHTGEAVTKSFACGVFAAFSQNQKWQGNVTMATRYLYGEGNGGLSSVMREIELMENGVHPTLAIGALKRPDFYRNLMGLHTYVTCDRWHLRAAYATDAKVELTADVRDIVTRATRIVAREYGESAMACQAVIWCHVRGESF